MVKRGCLYFALALAIFLWGQAARADDDDKPPNEIEYETRFVGADGSYAPYQLSCGAGECFDGRRCESTVTGKHCQGSHYERRGSRGR